MRSSCSIAVSSTSVKVGFGGTRPVVRRASASRNVSLIRAGKFDEAMDLLFEDVDADHYNLYVSKFPETLTADPFAVSSASLIV